MACRGEEKCSQGLVRKYEGTRAPGRPRRRGKNTVKMNFLAPEIEGMYLTDLTKDRGKCHALMNMGMSFQCSLYAGMFGTFKGKGRPIICPCRQRR